MKASQTKSTVRTARHPATSEKLPDIPTGLLTHFVLKALQESRSAGSALPVTPMSPIKRA